jgi:hypothetical protein
MKLRSPSSALLALSASLAASEYHVSSSGNNVHDGSAATPLQKISAVTKLAQPEETLTAQAGTYRKRITPPRESSSRQHPTRQRLFLRDQ